jgi:hypothetical protein
MPPEHFHCWAMLQGDAPRCDPIFYKEIPNPYMICPLATGLLTIFFKEHCTEIILIEDRLFEIKTLLFHKVARPQYL